MGTHIKNTLSTWWNFSLRIVFLSKIITKILVVHIFKKKKVLKKSIALGVCFTNKQRNGPSHLNKEYTDHKTRYWVTHFLKDL